jgi:hypothetical protein
MRQYQLFAGLIHRHDIDPLSAILTAYILNTTKRQKPIKFNDSTRSQSWGTATFISVTEQQEATIKIMTTNNKAKLTNIFHPGAPSSHMMIDDPMVCFVVRHFLSLLII